MGPSLLLGLVCQTTLPVGESSVILGELWNPLVSKQFQNVASIQVNLPQ